MIYSSLPIIKWKIDIWTEVKVRIFGTDSTAIQPLYKLKKQSSLLIHNHK